MLLDQITLPLLLLMKMFDEKCSEKLSVGSNNITQNLGEEEYAKTKRRQ